MSINSDTLTEAERQVYDEWYKHGQRESKSVNPPKPSAWAAMDARMRSVARAGYAAGRAAGRAALEAEAVRKSQEQAATRIPAAGPGRPVEKPGWRVHQIGLGDEDRENLAAVRTAHGFASDAEAVRWALRYAAANVNANAKPNGEGDES